MIYNSLNEPQVGTELNRDVVNQQIVKKQSLEEIIATALTNQLNINTLLTLFNDGEEKFKEALSNEKNAAKVYEKLLSYTDKNTDNKLSHEQKWKLNNSQKFINEICELLPEFMQSTVEIKTFAARESSKKHAQSGLSI